MHVADIIKAKGLSIVLLNINKRHCKVSSCCLFLNKPLETEWIGKTQPLNYRPGLLTRFDVPQWFISHNLLTQQWGKQTDKKNGWRWEKERDGRKH